MVATQSTHNPRFHLGRTLAMVGIALALVLGLFAGQAAASLLASGSGSSAAVLPSPPAGSGSQPAAQPTPSDAPSDSPQPTATPATTPTPAPTPTPVTSSKVIRVSIAQQRLTAYENGTVVLSTVVATGMPELATPKGTFHIKAKYSPYTFVSPWPKGDRFWYPTVTVSWAMLFADDGFFLHDSPHRTLYGPGANVTNGTHGCVNIPVAVMGQLYRWATVGTTVVIE